MDSTLKGGISGNTIGDWFAACREIDRRDKVIPNLV